jgi:oxygen-independent coproporphyrinogen-3 oxidase
LTEQSIPIVSAAALEQGRERPAGALDLPGLLARHLRPGTLTLSSLPPLSLYVHLPWCLKKCPYCDFNSHEISAHRSPGAQIDPARVDLPESRYLDALRGDLEAALPFVWGRRIHSVFIGGGTPSLFSPDAIDRLVTDLRALLPMEPGCEITLEANPGTFETHRFRAYRSAGVTRLSVGVQSFDDAKLVALGRVHDGAQARAALTEARAEFDTFNLDLMYALPGQTLAELDRDLDAALSFDPPHLSIYQLTIEPNTVFASRPPEGDLQLPDDDTAFDMLDRIISRTETTGLRRYEVSAFARPGHRCVHNLNYWQFGDYLGIGAGAHSKISFAHRVVRQIRFRDPSTYMTQALAGHAISKDEEVPRRQLPFEFMLNALRLKDGVERLRYTERTGMPFSAIEAPVQQGLSLGLLEDDSARFRATARGYDFLNDLQALFLPDERSGD